MSKEFFQHFSGLYRASGHQASAFWRGACVYNPQWLAGCPGDLPTPICCWLPLLVYHLSSTTLPLVNLHTVDPGFAFFSTPLLLHPLVRATFPPCSKWFNAWKHQNVHWILTILWAQPCLLFGWTFCFRVLLGSQIIRVPRYPFFKYNHVNYQQSSVCHKRWTYTHHPKAMADIDALVLYIACVWTTL